MKRLFILLALGIVLFALYNVFNYTTLSPIQAAQPPLTCDEDTLRAGLRTGGTLHLAADCTYHLTRNLPHIQADIVIEGNGATIDGQSTYRMLSAVSPLSITIHNLTLKNGAYGEGGALYVHQGKVTILDSTFENNQALFGSGGAIWVKQGSITLSQSRFIGNTAYDRGGAVWMGEGPVDIIDSTFSGNEASVGGGLYAYEGTITVTGSTFTTNAAYVGTYRSLGYDENGGGAIFAENQAVIITNSSFFDNVAITGSNAGVFAVGRGGGVNARSGDIVITSSTFTRNQAYIGGALYAHTGVIRATQSIIAQNQAEQPGADIPVDIRFESGGYNLIGDDGGGRLIVADSDIVNRDPQLAIDADNLPQLAADSPARDIIPSGMCATAADQLQTIRPQGVGCDIGAIEMLPTATGAVATVTPGAGTPTAAPPQLACNEADLRAAIAAGGHVTLPANCTITLTADLPEITTPLILEGNGAKIDGAGQYRHFFAPALVDLSFSDLTIQHGRDWGIWAARGNIDVAHVTLLHNGGAIYAGSGNVTATDCVIRDNTAEAGAAVYAYNGTITLTRCELEANQSITAGGAVWARYGPVTINDSVFYDNIAQSRNSMGGAVFVEQGPIDINNSTLRGSQAYQGGAVAAEAGPITVTDALFAGNRSEAEGGAIFAGSDVVTVARTRFEANGARKGGGIYTQESEIQVTGSQFIQNWSAIEGGGLAGELYTGITVTDCVFKDNRSGSGGGIGTVGWIKITNSLFYGNAARDGGAASAGGGMTVTASTVVHNVAEKEGGGLHARGLALQHSIVANNRAGSQPDLATSYYSDTPTHGYNLIGQPGFLIAVDTDIVGVDLGLILDAEGHYTLLPDSPALNAIPPDQCVTEADLWGQARPTGAGCEIGALEMGDFAVSPSTPTAPLEVTCNETSLINALHQGGDLNLAAGCVYTLTRDLPVVTINTTINGHDAVIDGSGQYRLLYAPASANITVRNLTLQNGVSSTSGGAIYANSGAVTVERCLIAHNAASEQGGGIYAGGPLSIAHSAIIDNQANENGGGAATAAYATLTNSTLAYNVTDLGGGGLYVYPWVNTSPVTPESEPAPATYIDHSTLAFNTASQRGGGAVVGGELVIQHSIVANNEAEETADLHFSSYQHLFHSAGYNVLGPNPRLFFAATDLVVADAKFDQFTGTALPLLTTSPALDLIPTEVCASDPDQRGTARPQGAGCDAGAVEMVQSDTFVAVPATATPAPPPPSILACAEESLSAAISQGGSFELPAECIITLTQDLPTITADFTLTSSASGIDGDGQYRIFHAEGLADITLSGLTLQHGHSERGGGLYAAHGDVSLTACTLRDNTADDDGGGLYAGHGRITITDSLIQHNTATGEYGAGGGLYLQGSDLYVINSQIIENAAPGSSGGGINVESGYATITGTVFMGNTSRDGGGLGSRGYANIFVADSRFERNIATGPGGGMYANSGPMVVERSVFIANTASNGGGLSTGEGAATITNSTFYANAASGDAHSSGGAVTGSNSTITLTRCTVAHNQAVYQGGAVSVIWGTLTLGQTIISSNTTSNRSDISIRDSVFTSHGYNLLDGTMDELSLVDTDIIAEAELEAFDATAGIFRLNPASPARDAVPRAQCTLEQDQRGTHRPQGPACDIGAVEMISDRE